MSSKLMDGTLLPVKLFAVLLTLAWASLTAPFFNTSPTYLEHIGNAGVRSFLGGLSPTQLQMLIPPFLDAYRSYCKTKGIKALIVPIPNTTASGFWIGDPQKAKYFSLYVHGGGYVLPGSPQHITMLEKFVKWSNNNLAVFCVAYTLSPEAVYPTALGQCVEGLRYILSLPQIKPANTLLTGDSAGGAVVLALLSHISSHQHPNSEIVKPLSLGDNERLKAAVIINPFISANGTRYASIKRFGTRDTFNEAAANAWMATYYGSKSGYENDMYICPAHADASYWKGTNCEKILCTAGGEEILQDAILDWAGKYRKGMTEGESSGKGKGDVLKVVIGQKETHILPILSPHEEQRLDELGEKSTEGALRAFIEENLGS